MAYKITDACISCGACVYQCPFGAITDKSSITQVISLIRNSGNNKNTRYKNFKAITRKKFFQTQRSFTKNNSKAQKIAIK